MLEINVKAENDIYNWKALKRVHFIVAKYLYESYSWYFNIGSVVTMNCD